jgi:hypothetical protein
MVQGTDQRRDFVIVVMKVLLRVSFCRVMFAVPQAGEKMWCLYLGGGGGGWLQYMIHRDDICHTVRGVINIFPYFHFYKFLFFIVSVSNDTESSEMSQSL